MANTEQKMSFDDAWNESVQLKLDLELQLKAISEEVGAKMSVSPEQALADLRQSSPEDYFKGTAQLYEYASKSVDLFRQEQPELYETQMLCHGLRSELYQKYGKERTLNISNAVAQEIKNVLDSNEDWEGHEELAGRAISRVRKSSVYTLPQADWMNFLTLAATEVRANWLINSVNATNSRINIKINNPR